MDENDRTDLSALALLRADVPPPTDDALTAARLRLTATMDVPSLGAKRASHRTRWTRRAAVGVAAAVAVGLGAFALTGQDPNPGPGNQAGPSTQIAPSTQGGPSTSAVAPAPHYATVAQLLDAASSAALRSVAPAGRYLHTSSHSRDTTSVDDPPANGAYEFTENRTDSWQPGTAGAPGYEHDVTNISVTAPTAKQRRYLVASGGLDERTDTWYRIAADGSETQVFPAGGDDPACAAGCGTPSAWDGATAQNVAALPTQVAALRADLFRYATKLHAEATKYGKPTTVGSIALQGVATVIGSGYAGATLRSALFQVAKTIPGITLNGAMANYDGVRGLAVTTTSPFDVQQNLIFAPDGSAFLGERDVVVHPSAQYHLKAGTVVTWTAVRTGITGAPTLPK